MIKARVTWNGRRRRWEVWEEEPGKPPQHHSFHRSEREAKAAARAQNVINMREAGLPCLNR